MNRLFERVGRGGIHEENHKIAARTAEDIGKILTRKRLLRSIREKTTESRSWLAGMLKRKGSNVYDDLTFLEGMGLLELEEGKAHVKKPQRAQRTQRKITTLCGLCVLSG